MSGPARKDQQKDAAALREGKDTAREAAQAPARRRQAESVAYALIGGAPLSALPQAGAREFARHAGNSLAANAFSEAAYRERLVSMQPPAFDNETPGTAENAAPAGILAQQQPPSFAGGSHE